MKTPKCLGFLTLATLVVGLTAYSLRADDCTFLQAQTEECKDLPKGVPVSPTVCESQTAKDCDYYLSTHIIPTVGCEYLDGTSNCAKSNRIQFLKCFTRAECVVVGGKCKVDANGYIDENTVTNNWYLETPCLTVAVQKDAKP